MSVMLDEALHFLDIRRGGCYMDCTLGGAGYTLALAAAAGPEGRIIGIDQDDLAIAHAHQELALRKIENVELVQDNFKNLEEIAAGQAGKIDGIVFDLGLSSAQLDDEARGFSFKGDRPLDMAFGPDPVRRTVDIVNRYPHGELARRVDNG